MACQKHNWLFSGTCPKCRAVQVAEPTTGVSPVPRDSQEAEQGVQLSRPLPVTAAVTYPEPGDDPWEIPQFLLVQNRTPYTGVTRTVIREEVKHLDPRLEKFLRSLRYRYPPSMTDREILQAEVEFFKNPEAANMLVALERTLNVRH